jgi:hypothetical protein
MKMPTPMQEMQMPKPPRNDLPMKALVRPLSWILLCLSPLTASLQTSQPQMPQQLTRRLIRPLNQLSLSPNRQQRRHPTQPL